MKNNKFATYRLIADILLVIAALLVVVGWIAMTAKSAGALQERELGYNHDVVSITCIDRVHWQYHNDDKSYCGEPESKPAQARTVSNSVPVVPTVEIPTNEPPIIVVTEEPKEDKPADTGKGNPGNTKGVGNAGEDPNGKGTMPLDNAGGNGNGEHGNQGQGGKKSSGGMWITLVILAKGLHEGKRITLWNVRHVEVDSKLTWIYFQSNEQGRYGKQKSFYFDNKDAKVIDACLYTGSQRLYTGSLDKEVFQTIAN